VRAWLIGLFLLAPAVVAASCALEDFTKVEEVSDAGPEAACGHATAPLPPDIDAGPEPLPDDAGLKPLTFVAALRVLRLDKTADAGDIGLDLDRFCSCQDDQRSCIPPKDQANELGGDLSNGIDNQGPRLFNLLQLALGINDLSGLYTGFAETGKWSLVLRVSGYNELPDDNKVQVDWFGSGGTVAAPLWDGQDAFLISDSTLMNSDINMPRFSDKNGYVTNNMLVFSLPNSAIDMAGPQTRISLKLTAGTVMARIEKNEKGMYQLRDGTIAARIKLEDLFEMVASFRDDNGVPFCTNQAFWGPTKDAFCKGLDIQSGFAEPNKLCDAVSFAVGFDADPAQMGPVQASNYDDAGCPPDADPVKDFIEFPCPQ